MKVLDNREKMKDRIDFGDVVVTNEAKWLVVDVSWHDEDNYYGFVNLDEVYLLKQTTGKAGTLTVNNEKIVEIIPSDRVALTLGEVK